MNSVKGDTVQAGFAKNAVDSRSNFFIRAPHRFFHFPG
jgi:hypothetical protein